MAFDGTQLTLMGTGNGYASYRYDTLDTHATVDSAGYFNNSDDNLNLAVGDVITVVVWATAIRTGTISTYGTQIVNAAASTGIVDVSDVTVNVVTDTD